MKDEALKNIQCVVGFDFGGRRIGVAVGQMLLGMATPQNIVANRDAGIDWAAIEKLLTNWQPQALVVGLPLNADGSDHATTKRARKFARKLATLGDFLVVMQDERLSSYEAEQAFKQARQQGHAKRKQAQQLDSVAAKFIVESWMAHPTCEHRL